MFDFLDAFTVGKKIKCKGKDYIVVGSIPSLNKNPLYYAITEDATFPAQVYVVQQDGVKNENQEDAKEVSESM